MESAPPSEEQQAENQAYGKFKQKTYRDEGFDKFREPCPNN